jgi:HAD superfamily hydrolase (TIGR01509 family)
LGIVTDPSLPTLLPAAVLWDMDGTLVDTEPYWMVAETELIASFGGTWTHEDGLEVVGMGLWDAAVIFQARGVYMTADAIIEWMTDRVLEQVAVEVPWRPGARELLADLKRAEVPTALVTMSVHRMAASIVDAIGFHAFDVIVGGDDVELAKPHPAPYLHAAGLLGVDILDCLAIEDSVPGLASAIASGAVTIGIPLHRPLDPGPNHTLWESLDGVTHAHVASHFAQIRSGASL